MSGPATTPFNCHPAHLDLAVDTRICAQDAGKACLIMQSDGNLVVYDERGAPRWASNTAGRPGSVAAEIPMALAHVAVLLGFAGMLLAVLLRAPQYLRNVFGSETAAVQKQVTDTFGTFD